MKTILIIAATAAMIFFVRESGETAAAPIKNYQAQQQAALNKFNTGGPSINY